MSKKVGLLGGSFNPAHAGHIHIAKQALEILGLNEVWLLVSPQNPNKPTTDMAAFTERFKSAQILAEQENNIIVSDFEKTNNVNRTFDSLTAMKSQYLDIDFVWIMGADNLVSFDSWYNWQEIFNMLPIAVFDRGDHKQQALSSPAATLFADNIIDAKQAQELITMPAPVWSFFEIEKHPGSSTHIRGSK